MRYGRFLLIKFIYFSAFICISMSAHAGGGIGIQAGAARYNVSSSGTTFASNGFEAGTGFTGRVYFDAGVFPNDLFSIEGGGTIENRKYTVTLAGLSNDELSYTDLVLEGLIRLHIPYVSFGLGVYAGFVLFDVSGSLSGTRSAGGAGISYIDTGFIGSGRLSIPVAPTLHLTADVRYVLGSADIANDDNGTNRTRDLQILAGVEFRL